MELKETAIIIGILFLFLASLIAGYECLVNKRTLKSLLPQLGLFFLIVFILFAYLGIKDFLMMRT